MFVARGVGPRGADAMYFRPLRLDNPSSVFAMQVLYLISESLGWMGRAHLARLAMRSGQEGVHHGQEGTYNGREVMVPVA